MITFISHPSATKDSKIMKIYWRHIKHYSSIYNSLAFHKNEWSDWAKCSLSVKTKYAESKSWYSLWHFHVLLIMAPSFGTISIIHLKKSYCQLYWSNYSWDIQAIHDLQQFHFLQRSWPSLFLHIKSILFEGSIISSKSYLQWHMGTLQRSVSSDSSGPAALLHFLVLQDGDQQAKTHAGGEHKAEQSDHRHIVPEIGRAHVWTPFTR